MLLARPFDNQEPENQWLLPFSSSMTSVLSFGGTPLLDGANLQVEPGDRICLGRNGSANPP